MNCPKCNAPVSEGAMVCAACGTAIGMVPGQPVPVYGRVAPPGGNPAAAMPLPGGGAMPPVTSAGLIARIRNISLTPKTEWPVIDAETTPTMGVMLGYVAPLAAFMALMGLIKGSVIGTSVPFLDTTFRVPIVMGLVSAVFGFVMVQIGLLIVAGLIHVFASTFGGKPDLRQAIRTAAYAFTPSFVASVFVIVPWLGLLLRVLIGCYAVYVLALGLPVMMKCAREKAAGYTAVVVICSMVLGLVLGGVMTLVGGIGAMAFGGAMSPMSATTRAQRDAVSEAQGAAIAGNVLGNVLGTDAKGKQDLSAALAGLAKAGEDAQRNAAAAPVVPADGSAVASAGTAPADAANAAAATAGLLTALGGAMGGKDPKAPVDFHALKDLLPASLPNGMARSNAEGSSTEAMGMKSASATGDYSGANQHVQIKIADMTSMAGLINLANTMAAKTETESDTGYEKSVKRGDLLVHETWSKPGQHGELSTVVAKRFTIEISGNGLEMADLEKTLDAIDLSQLAAMKNQNGK